jgi:hypothetical protein
MGKAREKRHRLLVAARRQVVYQVLLHSLPRHKQQQMQAEQLEQEEQ